MSTNAFIAAKTDTGYAGIYCHSDGYLDHTGKTLYYCYQDPKKVAELIALGDISFLDERASPIGVHSWDKPEDGTTIAYGRDRGETGIEARQYPTLEAMVQMVSDDYQHVYIFNGADWTHNGEDLASALGIAANHTENRDDPVIFTAQEVGHILKGLRKVQEDLLHDTEAAIEDLTDTWGVSPLSAEAIDELCERINCGDTDNADLTTAKN